MFGLFGFFLSANNISFHINIKFYENIEITIILVTAQQEHVSLSKESEIRFSI